ncbi:MAG TPA: T9SS type A sorting domain-containing protein [Bacteroidia bacterium]|nr:T9SS type A sorting domain-containing protein [Bacteroidia bacterium]
MNQTKKIKRIQAFLLLTCFVSGRTLVAQTITTSNSPIFGDVYTFQNCPYQTPGSAGLNQYWNFSNLVKSSTSNVTITFNHDTGLDFCTPGWLVAYGNAPGASGQVYALESVASGLYIWGLLNQPVPVICFSNDEWLMSYPFSYGNTFTDAWAGNTIPQLTPVHSLSGTTTATADGTGTLVTPAGVYVNTIRVHYTKDYEDLATTSSPSLSTYHEESYYWFVPGIRGELMRISNLSSSVSTPTQSLWYREGTYAGLINPTDSREELRIYPNPANESLLISLPGQTDRETTELVICNATGQELMRHKIQMTHEITFDISDLKPGLYFVHLLSDRLLLAEQKLIKQ